MKNIAFDYHRDRMLAGFDKTYCTNGWRLSPLYDVNPVAEGDELALNVSEEDNRISVDLAIETAHYYGIKEADAVRMAEEILVTVRDNWERIAKQCGLSRTDIEDKRPAFSICYKL